MPIIENNNIEESIFKEEYENQKKIREQSEILKNAYFSQDSDKSIKEIANPEISNFFK